MLFVSGTEELLVAVAHGTDGELSSHSWEWPSWEADDPQAGNFHI